MIKLSKVQEEVLRAAASSTGFSGVDWYPPVKRLTELGFIRESRPHSSDRKPTDAGLAWIKAKDASLETAPPRPDQPDEPEITP